MKKSLQAALALARRMSVASAAAALVIAFFPACSRQSAPADGGAANSVPELRLTDQASGLLFTYLVADGTFQTVETIEQVPTEARSRVVVTDTSRSPEERQSSRIIFVADLSTRRDDGTYPCRPVSRFAFERDLLREPSAVGALPEDCRRLEPSPTDRAILYATSWCSVCQATEKFLRQSGIPYQKKDIEADHAAERELACKALKSGTRVDGVPVLDIGGKLLVGFDRDDILRLSTALQKTGTKI